jgi:hypothetical protein
MQQRPGVLDPDLLERLSTWGQTLRELARKNAPGGVQLIRRDAAIASHLPAVHSPTARAPAGHHRLS